MNVSGEQGTWAIGKLDSDGTITVVRWRQVPDLDSAQHRWPKQFVVLALRRDSSTWDAYP